MGIHSKHANSSITELPRLSGWWGVPFDRRFKMEQEFNAAKGAAGFLCSNAPPLLVACVQKSLEVFAEAGGITATRRKSLLVTGYLELLLQLTGLTATADSATRDRWVEIVTPSDPEQRGCQLSLRVCNKTDDTVEVMTMHALEKKLDSMGVSADTREPDIIRISPAPLYNNFSDVHRFVGLLDACLA